MKIALFTDSYTPYVSGVVRSIQRFTQGLAALGHEIYIFAPHYPYDQEIKTTPGARRVFRFYSLPAPNYPKFSLPIPLSPRADKVVRRLNIDIIHTHSPFLMGRLGAAIARRHGIPLVFTHHTLYHEYHHYIPAPKTLTRQIIISLLQRYCRRCDQIIAPTPLIKDLIKQLYRVNTPISVLPTGIDLTLYEHADRFWLRQKHGISSSEPIILFVGRLGKEKNVHLLLEAFFRLSRLRPDCHLVLVGDGPEKEALEQSATKLGLKAKVHFTGVLSSEQVVNAYAGADLFLFASVTETQGLVMAEAMAAGLPVVAVKATGSEDLVIPGFNGLLTECSAPALAEKAYSLLNDPDKYRITRQNALLTAGQLSIENTSRMLADTYYKLLPTRHSDRLSLQK